MPQLPLLLKSVVASAVAVSAVLSPLVWPWVLVLKLLTRPLEVSWEAAAAMEMPLNNSSRHNSQFSMLNQLNTLSPLMSSPLSRFLKRRAPAWASTSLSSTVSRPAQTTLRPASRTWTCSCNARRMLVSPWEAFELVYLYQPFIVESVRIDVISAITFWLSPYMMITDLYPIYLACLLILC
jgi:hypothetical protein